MTIPEFSQLLTDKLEVINYPERAYRMTQVVRTFNTLQGQYSVPDLRFQLDLVGDTSRDVILWYHSDVIGYSVIVESLPLDGRIVSDPGVLHFILECQKKCDDAEQSIRARGAK